eukprot:4521385-Alexandrium_andersonii.AAC.1
MFCALRARIKRGPFSLPQSSEQPWMQLACASARQWTCRMPEQRGHNLPPSVFQALATPAHVAAW